MPSVEDGARAIARDLLGRRGPGVRPLIVAIDGRSGVGKSTLAREVAVRVGASIVEGDDFFAGGVGVRSEPDRLLADRCIDRARLRGVLTTLRSGHAAAYRPFDWNRFDGRLAGLPKTVEAREIVLAEGVYSFHPDLRDVFGASILVEAPEDVRSARLVRREGAISEWERQWHRAEAWYFEHLSPPPVFDTIVRTA